MALRPSYTDKPLETQSEQHPKATKHHSIGQANIEARSAGNSSTVSLANSSRSSFTFEPKLHMRPTLSAHGSRELWFGVSKPFSSSLSFCRHQIQALAWPYIISYGTTIVAMPLSVLTSTCSGRSMAARVTWPCSCTPRHP